MLHDADIAVTVCRQEGGAAMMAEAQGKLHGPARHLLCDARARCDQRFRRYSHRAPGFDAHDPVLGQVARNAMGARRFRN